MPKSGKRYEWEVGKESGNPLSALFQDFDWADEVLHARVGRDWYVSTFEDRKEAVADAVEIEVRQAFDREVPSVEIGRRVAARLRDVDPIAYIRYASEYYEFRTLEDLAKEVSREQSRARPAQGQGEFFQEQE